MRETISTREMVKAMQDSYVHDRLAQRYYDGEVLYESSALPVSRSMDRKVKKAVKNGNAVEGKIPATLIQETDYKTGQTTEKPVVSLYVQARIGSAQPRWYTVYRYLEEENR